MSRPVIGLGIFALLQVVALAVMATLPQWMEVLPTTQPGEQLSAVVVGIAMAQGALAALLLLAGTSWFLRTTASAALLAGALLTGVAYHRQADRGEEVLLTGLVLAAFLGIAGFEVLAVCAGVAKWGYRLGHPASQDRSPLSGQFHLWHLLAVMTALGGLLALGRFAYGPLRSDIELETVDFLRFLAVIAIIATTAALISLAAIMALLAPRRALWLWCGAVILAIVVCAGELLLIEYIDGPHANRWHWAVNAGTFAWMTLSLLPVRLAGWRMGRQEMPQINRR